MLGAIIRTLLISDPGVAALLRGGVNPEPLPQGATAFPAIVYKRISHKRTRSYGGPTRLSRARVEINSLAKKSDEAEALGAAVRVRLDGYRGPVPGSEDVQGIEFITARKDYDNEALLHRHSADYYVWHEED